LLLEISLNLDPNSSFFGGGVRAITLGSDGSIFAVDKGAGVIKFDSMGDILWSNTEAVELNGLLETPLGIDLDSEGNIYVADTGRDGIIIFDENGVFIREFRPFGNNYSPVGVAVNADGSMVILERLQFEKHIVDAVGS